MGDPRNWDGEENLTLQRKMAYLIREIMSSHTSLDMNPDMVVSNHPMVKFSRDLKLKDNYIWAAHSYAHSARALEMAVEIQKDIQNFSPPLPSSLKNFYFTFGVGDKNNSERYVHVRSKNYIEAREVMINYFGTKWAFQYPESEWTINGVSLKTKYNLTRICVKDDGVPRDED